MQQWDQIMQLAESPAIYAIKHNVTDGRMYVGSAKSVRRRLAAHFSDLTGQRHHCPPLQSAWNEHGQNAFVIDILEWVRDLDKLAAREQHWMDELQSFVEGRGFNSIRIATRPRVVDRGDGRINCRVPQSYMTALEAIRASRHDRPDVAQIVRELLGKALADDDRLDQR